MKDNSNIGIFNDVLYGTILGSACLSAIFIRLVLIKILTKIDPNKACSASKFEGCLFSVLF